MPSETTTPPAVSTPPWQAQAVWVATAPDGELRVAVFPPRVPATTRLILCNDPLPFLELLEGSTEAAQWLVIDLAALFRLLHPESAAAGLAEMLARIEGDMPPEQRLWRLWLRCESRLCAFPLWALDEVAAICQALDDNELAALFRLAARQAETRRDALRNWTDTFPATVRRVERAAPPDLADCSAVDAAAAVALLDQDGALARCVAGYEPRPGQLMMVRAVVEAINAGRHLLVEAGTGIGKSLGYLLPAALWSQLNDVPVVISTNTRNLQTQLVEKDLPAVQRMLAERSAATASGEPPRPLRTALIKGRGNYLCLRRLAHQMEQAPGELPRRERRQLAAVLCWAVHTPDGDLDTLAAGATMEQGIAAQLNAHADDCAGHACRFYRRCFVQKARERAHRADLVIANHSLVFTELGATTPIALPRHAQIIFDEAHNLEEAATRHFSTELSPARLATLARRLASGRGRRRRGLLERLRRRFEGGTLRQSAAVFEALMQELDAAGADVEALRRDGSLLFRRLYDLLPAGGTPVRIAFPAASGGPPAPPPAPNARWQAIREAQASLEATLLRLIAGFKRMIDRLAEAAADELNLLAEETADLTGGIQALTSLHTDLADVLAAADPASVFWVQRATGPEPLAEAWAAPLKVGPLLAKHLYEAKSSVVFCSATLSVGGRFTYIGERLGLDAIAPGRLATCLAPSPFDYARQCTLLAPAYLPDPTAADRSYITELTILICQVAAGLGGRTLCLFTSYDMLRQCARLAEPALQAEGITLLVHGESGSRDLLLRTFRQDSRCVLFGTHSFWEGVDVVGDALSCVILARLPFASPGDPVFSARCEQLDRDGQPSFRALSLPAAVLRLRQGFGRLIRHRGDRGLVIVADTRMLTKPYGATFRRNLPCAVQVCESAAGLLDHLASYASPSPSPPAPTA